MKKIFFFTFLMAFILISFQLIRNVYFSSESPKHISGAYDALNFWGLQRAYPNSSIPDIASYAAFEYSRQNLQGAIDNSFPGEIWQPIGPVNLGGRTLAIAFNPLNPNTIYAGSASGGLWRSKSGGRGADAWEYVPTGFPVLGVSSIAFVPGDSNTIYIGTGEVYNYQNVGTDPAFRNTRGSYGIGILKTTDGGVTWSKSLDWSYNQRNGVWAVRVNPLNPNTVWAATTEGTYKSTDAGATWTLMHNVIMGMDLVINPVDTNTVFVSYGNFQSSGYGIYRTTDGGTSWTKLTQGLPTSWAGKVMLDIYPSSPNIVFASIGNGFTSGNGASWLCKSTNNGDTWTIVSTRDYSKWQGWYAHDVAVNPINSDEVIAIGIEIYKSTTGGSNLVQISSTGWYSGRIPPEGPEGPPTYSHVDHHDVVYHPTDANIIYFANDGGVFRTIDGGQTFESCNGGYQTSQFYGGFSSSATDSLLSMGGCQDNSSQIYDGQQAWFVRLIGGDGGWTAINPVDGEVMYGSSQFLNLRKSTNGGASFFGISVPNITGGPTVFIAPFVLATDNAEILYAGRDIVYKSTNGGASWNAYSSVPLDGNPLLAMAVSPLNSDVVYAATAPFVTRMGVFRTVNGGLAWANVTGTLPDRFPGDLIADPISESTAYLTLMGFGTSHVFMTNDYGSTWQDIDNGLLPDVPTSTIVVDPLNPAHIYIGNDIGVYFSPDGGITWQEFRTGLPDGVIVMDLSVSPLNRKLRLATHGNGAYERDLLDDIVSVPSTTPIASIFELAQNYPNPFNPSTTIRYRLEKGSTISLRIYNAAGQEVKTLLEGFQPAGSHSIVWDGTNNRGERVASAVYFYRLSNGENTLVRKMQLLR